MARWWTPDEFDGLRSAAVAMGFSHVQASPLTRSSYHARQAAEASVPVHAGSAPDAGPDGRPPLGSTAGPQSTPPATPRLTSPIPS